MSFVQALKSLILFFALIAGPLPVMVFLIQRFAPARKTKLIYTIFHLLMGWSLISTLLALAFGILGVLRTRPILGSEIILFITGCFLLWQGGRKGTLPAFKSLWETETDWDKSEKFVLVFLAITFLVVWWNISVNAIFDYDSLFYHLPNMAEWYQSGTIDRLPSFGQASYYPYNWEALSTLFLFPFHNDLQVSYPNLLALGIAAISISIICIEMGIRRIYALTILSFLSPCRWYSTLLGRPKQIYLLRRSF